MIQQHKILQQNIRTVGGLPRHLQEYSVEQSIFGSKLDITSRLLAKGHLYYETGKA